MVKLNQYDVVQLKDGRKGAVVEIFNEKYFMFEAEDDVDLELPTVSVDEISSILWRKNNSENQILKLNNEADSPQLAMG